MYTVKKHYSDLVYSHMVTFTSKHCNTNYYKNYKKEYVKLNIIENLYRSLQRLTFFNFEWLVVDDGLTDNTEQLFEQWIKEENLF